jgi:hypothetical protein
MSSYRKLVALTSSLIDQALVEGKALCGAGKPSAIR